MNRQLAARMTMTGLGLALGLGLYIFAELAQAGLLTGRALLGAGALIGAFSVAVLSMAGPLPLARAAMGAAAVALAVTALLVLASLGFVTADGAADNAHVVLAGVVLTLVPLPFWIAAQRGRWQEYPVLFGESWNIVVRAITGWAFAGLVWAVIFLSDALLGMVGITLIDTLIDLGPVPWLVTGGALGLGLGVVQELSDYVSPYLVLRLLRLLLPVVFVVSAVFLLALPLRGVSGLFGSLSFSFTLLTMAGAVATLITTAVDQDAAQATQSRLLIGMSRLLALMLPLMAALGVWGLWLRVGQYGWTPERVFAAKVAALALGYGLLYALAVLRGAGWMDRIRQANVWMALALMAVAALSLIPPLSAERLSAASLMARLEDGRLPMAEFDAALLSRWGKPGAEALAQLEERAAQPGQEALAAALQRAQTMGGADDRAQTLAELTAVLPLQPAGAVATRDLYLAVLDDYRLRDLRANCVRQMPGGGAGCVMVVADLQPDQPGEEAVILSYAPGGFVDYIGFRNDLALGPAEFALIGRAAALPQQAEGSDLIRAWQAAPPPLAPVMQYQLTLPGGGGLMMAP